MTANWFEAKVKYVKVGEDGKEKKMSELYLLDAMSYTEAESRITENLREMIQGDFYIVGLKKSNITELVESNDGNDDKWFKAKVAIIDADQISGKEKKSNQYWLRERILTVRWLICIKVCQLTWCLSRSVPWRIQILWTCSLISRMMPIRRFLLT